MRIIWMSMILCLFFGCSDFLEEVDKDKLIPTKTEHYESVLVGIAEHNFPIFGAVDYMTDNLTEYSYEAESNRKGYKPVYTWQIEIEMDEEGNRSGSFGNVWTTSYKNIAIANYVEEFVDDAEGTEEEKMFIKGEASFLRAWCYFNLLNLYGKPYNPESARRDLGVPLRLDNGIEQTYQRSTVAECYRLIEEELQAAIRLLESSGITKSKHHPSVGTCALLLSRVYLYQERWQDAIDAATEAMKYGSLSRIPSSGLFVTEENAEIFYAGMFSNATLSHLDFEKGWQVSSDLLNLYNDRDLRKSFFFSRVSGKQGRVYYSNKGERSYYSIGRCCMRKAEVYLNRAEAYARLNMVDEAVADMQDLLETRYSRPSDFTVPKEVETLLDFILTERRKELCFEEHHRWFDLRRMGENAPELTHRFTLTDETGTAYGTQRYTLFPGDLNYTLPIPLKERDNNPLIENNERYEKLPETDDTIII